MKSIGNQKKSIANRENLLEIRKSREKSNRNLEILHESTEIRDFEISYAYGPSVDTVPFSLA